MKILITGATGFLGGAAARHLTAKGHQVLGTGRSESAGVLLEKDGIEFQPADIRDAGKILELIRGNDAVIHCAALSSPWGRAAEFDSINRLGTDHVIKACQESGVTRLVHISTPGIYVGLGDRLLVKEDAQLPAKPANHYVRTKLAAEGLVQDAFEAGLSTITLRPRGIYGPGDTVVLPRLIRALETGRLPRIGQGQTVMDLTFVDNAAGAIECALLAKDHLGGRTYNVTDGQPIELWPFIDQLCERLQIPKPSRTVSLRVVAAYASVLELVHRTVLRGREPLMTRYTATLLARSLTLDISAARNDLGYTPTVGPEEGLDLFAKWWSRPNE
ncbi:MAG: NAD(P)-dependent oxidoreductase [Planctomycetes bacterium]|nr:NAD(P)-dependent oxidoreductase [Planctomycetota bacterium]